MINRIFMELSAPVCTCSPVTMTWSIVQRDGTPYFRLTCSKCGKFLEERFQTISWGVFIDGELEIRRALDTPEEPPEQNPGVPSRKLEMD